MTQTQLHEVKAVLREHLRRYPLDRLCMLLAHAQCGRLVYHSCCCIVGVETADHRLRTAGEPFGDHYRLMHAVDCAGLFKVELAYDRLGIVGRNYYYRTDKMRRARAIPMIRAELRRREREVARGYDDAPERLEVPALRV